MCTYCIYLSCGGCCNKIGSLCFNTFPLKGPGTRGKAVRFLGGGGKVVNHPRLKVCFFATYLTWGMSVTCKFEVYCFEWGKAEGAKRPRLFFAFRAKRPLHTGVRTGCHYLISLSVRLSVCLCICQCACNIRRFYRMRELYEPDFHKPGIYGSGRVRANAWDVGLRAPSRGGSVAGLLWIQWCVWVGRIFRAFHEFAFPNSFVDPEQPASNR